jgi:hypothetical protein
VQTDIFLGPCYGISSVGYIYFMVGSNIIKKFMSLTHLTHMIKTKYKALFFVFFLFLLFIFFFKQKYF